MSESILWCCHVRGPDDVHAAPDYETALAWSDMLNATNWAAGRPGTKIPDPTSFDDCLIKAVPAPWPYSPKSHAEDLPKSIAGFHSASARMKETARLRIVQNLRGQRR